MRRARRVNFNRDVRSSLSCLRSVQALGEVEDVKAAIDAVDVSVTFCVDEHLSDES